MNKFKNTELALIENFKASKSDFIKEQNCFEISENSLVDVCIYLKEQGWDFLNLITATDFAEKVEIVYSVQNIIENISCHIKVFILKHNDNVPEIETVSHIWSTANWHEREAYDLVGVGFKNHPDLRRILLPDDWSGHPLKVDYVELESYHQIKVPY